MLYVAEASRGTTEAPASVASSSTGASTAREHLPAGKVPHTHMSRIHMSHMHQMLIDSIESVLWFSVSSRFTALGAGGRGLCFF